MKTLSKAERYALFLLELKELRQHAKLSQTELALRIGASQDYISRCESGARRVDVAELQMWADACGSSLVAFSQRLVERISRENQVRRVLS